VGLVLFCIAFFPFIFRRALFEDIHARSLMVFFLFNIFALGSIGDPLPFIFFALAYRTVMAPKKDDAEAPTQEVPSS
jgi:hypothetical protein